MASLVFLCATGLTVHAAIHWQRPRGDDVRIQPDAVVALSVPKLSPDTGRASADPAPIVDPNRLPMPAMHPDPTARTIFVSIAAYRDAECQKTVRELFTKAKHPGRVHLGVVCQRMFSRV